MNTRNACPGEDTAGISVCGHHVLVGAEGTSTTNRSVCSSQLFALSQMYHTNSGTTDTILAQVQKQQCSSNIKRMRGSPLPYRRKAARRHVARQCKLRETTGTTSSSRKQHAAQLKLNTKWNENTHGTEWNSPCGRVVAITSAVGGESELCCWSGVVGRLTCVGGLTFLPLFPFSQPSRHQGSIASTSSRVLTYDDLTMMVEFFELAV